MMQRHVAKDGHQAISLNWVDRPSHTHFFSPSTIKFFEIRKIDILVIHVFLNSLHLYIKRTHT